MKKYYLLFVFIFLLSDTYGQNTDDSLSSKNSSEASFNFYTLEKKPQFTKGGDKGLIKWISNNARYPSRPLKLGIEGRVFVGFTIEKDGTISNVKVLRGVSPSLDKEALRVVKEMPKWKPGKQKGKHVRGSYQVPISFKLQKKSPKE